MTEATEVDVETGGAGGVVRPRPPALFGDRRDLPSRRPNITFSFKHAPDLGGNELGYRCTIGYQSAELHAPMGEIFIIADKHESALDAGAADGAIAVSLALQHGATVAKVAGALRRRQSGEAASPLGAALDVILKKGWEVLR